VDDNSDDDDFLSSAAPAFRSSLSPCGARLPLIVAARSTPGSLIAGALSAHAMLAYNKEDAAA